VLIIAFFMILSLGIYSYSIKNFNLIKKEAKKEKLIFLLYKAKLLSFINKTCLSIASSKIIFKNKIYHFPNINSNFNKICFLNGKPNKQGSIYFYDIKISINYAGVFNVYKTVKP